MSATEAGWQNARAAMRGLDFIEGVNEAQLMRMVVQAEKENKGGTVEMAQALATLAGLFLVRDRRAMAEPLLERSFAIFCGVEGVYSEAAVTVCENLLIVYEDTQQYTKADELRQCVEAEQLPPAMLKWTLQLPTPNSSPVVSPILGSQPVSPLDLRPATSHAQNAMRKQGLIDERPYTAVEPDGQSLADLRAGYGVDPSMRPDVAASKKQQIMRDLDQLSDARLLDRLRILERQPDTEMDTGRVLMLLAARMSASNQHTAAGALLERAVEVFTAAHCTDEAVEALQGLMDVSAERSRASESDIQMPELIALRTAVEAASMAKQARDLVVQANESRARSPPPKSISPARERIGQRIAKINCQLTPVIEPVATSPVVTATPPVNVVTPQSAFPRRMSLPPPLPATPAMNAASSPSVDTSGITSLYIAGRVGSVIPVETVEVRSPKQTKKWFSKSPEPEEEIVQIGSDEDALATMADAEEQIKLLANELQLEEGVQWDEAAELILQKEQHIDSLQKQVVDLRQQVVAAPKVDPTEALEALQGQLKALEQKVNKNAREKRRSRTVPKPLVAARPPSPDKLSGLADTSLEVDKKDTEMKEKAAQEVLTRCMSEQWMELQGADDMLFTKVAQLVAEHPEADHEEEPDALQSEMGDVFHALSRVYLKKLLYSNCCQGVGSAVMVVLVVTACLMPVSPTSDYEWTSVEEVSWVLYILAIAYSTIEVSIRMYSMGLYAFVQGGCNRLDLIVLGCSWPSIVLTTVHFNIGPLRAIRLLMRFDGVKAISVCLFSNRWVFANLLVLFGLVLTMFGIIAIEGFDTSLDNWCSYNGELALPVHGCSTDSGSGFHCAQPTTTGAIQHTCSTAFDRPQNHHGAFNNFGNAFLLNFEIVARGNLWYYLSALRARETNVVMIYPAILLLIVTLFIKSLLAAAVVTATLELAHSSKSEADDHDMDGAAQDAITDELDVVGEPRLDDNQAVIDARAVADKLREQGREEEAAAIYEELAISEGMFTQECYGLRAKAGWLVRDPGFDHVILFLVLCNTALLGSQHADQPDSWTDVIFWSEVGFTSLFTLEALFKIFGVGIQFYFSDLWNRFDFTIVVLSLVSFIGTDSNVTALRAFRGFRGLRIARVLRDLPSVMGTLRTIYFAGSGLIDVCILLMGVIVLVALCGMQLFGKQSDGNELSGNGWGRANFDTWGSSVLVLVQVLTSDRWEQTMYDLFRTEQAWAAAPFFILFWFFGHFILLNLFLGVMMQAIARSAAEGNTSLSISSQDLAAPLTERLEAYYKKYSPTNLDKLPQLMAFYAGNEGPLWGRLDSKYGTEIYGLTPMQQTQLLIFEQDQAFVMALKGQDDQGPLSGFLPGCMEKTEGSLCWNILPGSCIRRWCVQMHDSFVFKICSAVVFTVSCLMLVIDGPESERSDLMDKIDDICDHVFLFWWTMECLTGCIAHGLYWTLTDYGVESKYAISVSKEKRLEAQAAMEAGQTNLEDTPRDDAPQAQYRVAYMSQRFHKLDFILLLLTWCDFAFDMAGKSSLWVPLGRALRPLRVLSIVPTVGALIEGLLMATGALRNVVLMTLMGILIFAVVGLQLMCNMLSSCSDSTISTQIACVGMMSKPIVQCATILPDTGYCGTEEYMLPRSWQTRHRNFDNMGEALLTLFEIGLPGSGSGLLYAMLDADNNDQSDRNSAWYMALYYCAFMLFASMMILQLISAVVVDAYAQSQPQLVAARNASDVNAIDLNTDGVLSPEELRAHADAMQKEDVKHMQRMVLLVAPFEIPKRPSHSCIRCFCYDTCIAWDGNNPYTVGVHHYSHWIRRYFDSFMLLFTAVNVILLTTKHAGQSDWWSDFLYSQDCAFLGLFSLEVTLKMIALLPVIYFRRMAHLFDFLIVVGAVISLGFEGSRLQSAFRALRVVRLALRLQGTRAVLLSMIPALRPMFDLFVLILAFFCVYASLGMHLFSDLRYGVTIGQDYNFDSFRSSITVLWMVAFGDRWVDTAEDCARRPPLCTDGQDCGSSWSTPFFTSFVGIVDVVALQLAVAIVLEGYSWLVMMQRGVREGVEKSDNLVEQLEPFSRAFHELDPMSQGSIALRDLEQLVVSVGPPVGRTAPVDKNWLESVVAQLEALPVHVRGRANFGNLWSVLTGQVEVAADNGFIEQPLSRPGTTSRPGTRGRSLRPGSRVGTPNRPGSRGSRVSTPSIGSRPVTRGDVGVRVFPELPEIAEDRPTTVDRPTESADQQRAPPVALQTNPLTEGRSEALARVHPMANAQQRPLAPKVIVEHFPAASASDGSVTPMSPGSDDEDQEWDEMPAAANLIMFQRVPSALTAVIEDESKATDEELLASREQMRQSRRSSLQSRSQMQEESDIADWEREAAGLGILVEPAAPNPATVTREEPSAEQRKLEREQMRARRQSGKQAATQG